MRPTGLGFKVMVYIYESFRMDWNVLFQNCNLLICNKFLIYFNKKNNFKKARNRRS